MCGYSLLNFTIPGVKEGGLELRSDVSQHICFNHGFDLDDNRTKNGTLWDNL